jgi:hypothetical protein
MTISIKELLGKFAGEELQILPEEGFAENRKRGYAKSTSNKT